MADDIFGGLGSILGLGGDSQGGGGLNFGTILALGLPAAIQTLGTHLSNESNQGWEREQLAMQAAEAQKNRDLELLLAKMQMGAAGGAAGAQAAIAKKRLLFDALQAAAGGHFTGAQLKGDAIDRFLGATQGPMMQVTGR
jgi:hypothetical protein